MVASFIAEMTEGSRVSRVFTLRSRDVRVARNGDAYLAVELADRTGVMPGVLFRPSADAVAIPSSSVVRVSGTVTTFKGSRRVSMDSMTPAERYDPKELISDGPRPIDEVVAEFKAMAATISRPSLRRLMRGIFGDPSIMSQFTACPASEHHHYAHAGGLVAHSVNVATLCAYMADRYQEIDRDLLVCAALLHDIGKIDELKSDAGVRYSDEGRLVGHVVSGLLRIRDAARSSRMEPSELLRLEHAVLSHHGELEWGSPKRPSTLEALVLHHADNMDAKTACFTSFTKGASLSAESWTDASNLFRRPLFAPLALEDDRSERPDEDLQYRRRSA